VGAVAVGLLVEEHRKDIQDSWKRMVEAELGGEPAIGFAAGPLLRELSLALRGEEPALRSRTTDALSRCTVLVRSSAPPARTAREFKLLHRALWDTLRRAARIVAADERRAADEWLDEALAATLDRLDRVRMRIDLLERSPAMTPVQPRPAAPAPLPARPPPLPAARAAPRPPPLPALRP